MPIVLSHIQIEPLLRVRATGDTSATTSADLGRSETTVTLDECVERINGWSEAARSVRDDVIVLCHGGPIAMPEDAAYVLSRCKGCDGFYGASSMERLPTEQAIKAQIEAFSSLASER